MRNPCARLHPRLKQDEQGECERNVGRFPSSRLVHRADEERPGVLEVRDHDHRDERRHELEPSIVDLQRVALLSARLKPRAPAGLFASPDGGRGFSRAWPQQTRVYWTPESSRDQHLREGRRAVGLPGRPFRSRPAAGWASPREFVRAIAALSGGADWMRSKSVTMFRAVSKKYLCDSARRVSETKRL